MPNDFPSQPAAGASLPPAHADDLGPDKHRPRSVLAQLKRYDETRPDFPGEHLIVFGVGALLMLAGIRGGGVVRRAVLTAVGTALIGRAASGTGGVARLARVVKRLG
ncbi:hypothetical protein [Bordetella genomosp. 7]|uniref:hypothetical protein n=1 Tax=Bordetella genomosp. 7 TaxID=1416805 RepID=UPI0020168056|nr:hypothetical protein [Bordetella genomosp. 7]